MYQIPHSTRAITIPTSKLQLMDGGPLNHAYCYKSRKTIKYLLKKVTPKLPRS